MMSSAEKIPDWLLKAEIYHPPKENAAFIDRSILGILGLLSRMRQEDRSGSGFIYRLDPTVKFLAVFLSILLISLSKNLLFIMLADSAALLLLSFLHPADIKKILSILLVVIIFTTAVLSPSYFLFHSASGIWILLKMPGCILSANIFSYTTRWRHVTRALKMVRLPDIFILILDITLKYIFLLGEFSLQMLYSLKTRSVGKNPDKILSLSGLMGNLFLKSKESAELLYAAMECRCFDGSYKTDLKLHFGWKETWFTLGFVLLAAMFFVL